MSLLDAVEVFEMVGTPNLYGMRAKRRLEADEVTKLCQILAILNDNGGGVFVAVKDQWEAARALSEAWRSLPDDVN